MTIVRATLISAVDQMWPRSPSHYNGAIERERKIVLTHNPQASLSTTAVAAPSGAPSISVLDQPWPRETHVHTIREKAEKKAPALARRDELLKEENLLLTRERG